MDGNSNTSNVSNASNISDASNTSNMSDVGGGGAGDLGQNSSLPPAQLGDLDNTSAQALPVSPVGAKAKEQQPVEAGRSLDYSRDFAEADKVAKAEGDEYWENYAREIELEKQILEMGGVEKVENGEVKLPEEVAKEMGVKPTVEVHTPIEKVTGFSVSGVGLDDSQLSAGAAKPTSSGFKWLVEWFIYQLLKAHYHIKRVKGKITRQGPEPSATPPEVK